MTRPPPFRMAIISASAALLAAFASFAFLYWVADSDTFTFLDGFLFVISQWLATKLMPTKRKDKLKSIRSTVLAIAWWPLCIVSGFVGLWVTPPVPTGIATFLFYAFPAVAGVLIGSAILHPATLALQNRTTWFAVLANLTVLAAFVLFVRRFDYGGSIQTKHYGAFVEFAYLLPLAPINGSFFGYQYATTRQPFSGNSRI